MDVYGRGCRPGKATVVDETRSPITVTGDKRHQLVDDSIQNDRRESLKSVFVTSRYGMDESRARRYDTKIRSVEFRRFRRLTVSLAFT